MTRDQVIDRLTDVLIDTFDDDDLDGGSGYPVITGDYSAAPAWAPRDVVPGTPVAAPSPIFTKLDESVVEEELARLRGDS